MLADLPHELATSIAGYLEPCDLVVLLITSKFTRAIAQQQRLWYAASGSKQPFNHVRDYHEGYIWQHGSLAVHIRSDLAPKDEHLFELMSFFPLHRSYRGSDLALLSRKHLLWAADQLAGIDEDLLILSCCRNRMIAHVYREPRNQDGRQHNLVLLSNECREIWLSGLSDWPLCACFIGENHVLVCGRFPAALLYDLRSPCSPMGIPLTSHTINCLCLDDSSAEQRILLCGHYKGRGSMEVLHYHYTEAGDLILRVAEQNKFAGVTAIVSCAYLPSGSFMTYDNYSHIYLWSSIRDPIRKIDHDGIGDEIPNDMIYKMFYNDRQLIFIDQYKRQNAFCIKPGRQIVQDKARGEIECEQAKVNDQVKSLLFRQNNDMASLTRRILGF